MSLWGYTGWAGHDRSLLWLCCMLQSGGHVASSVALPAGFHCFKVGDFRPSLTLVLYCEVSLQDV